MVTRAQIQELADRIAAGFDVERIILFGSQADGTATADSDVDLMVLMEFEGRPMDMAVRIRVCGAAAVRVRPDRPHAGRRRAALPPARSRSCGIPLITGEVLYERGLAGVG